MVDVQKAFEYKCFEADSRELYGPLADAFGRYSCSHLEQMSARAIACTWRQE